MSNGIPEQHIIPAKRSQPWWIVWLILGMMVIFFGGCTMMIGALGKASSTANSFRITGSDDFTETV